MEQRIRRDSALISLVSEFETNFENGNLTYIGEKSFFQIIGYYEEEKEYEKALDVVNVAIEQFKYRSDFYIAKSRILIRLNAIEECLECIGQAQTIAPYENEIIILKAKALALSGSFGEAFLLLEEVKQTSLKTDLVELYICESDIYNEMCDHLNRYESLKKAIKLDIRNEEALEKIWVATELSKQYFDCAKLMNFIINNDPYNHLAWYNLGHAMSFTGNYSEAIEALEYSFIVSPQFEDGYKECAELCCQVKDFDRAESVYTEAIQAFGEENDLLISLAECQLYLNKITESKRNLFRAVKLDPYNDEIYYLIGECFSKEEKWYSAINAYHKAIEIEDESGEYFLGLARAYVEVEDYNKATVNFHMAVSDGPEQTHFWCEFVSFLMKLGLYSESIQVLDEAEEYTFGADLLYCRAMANFFLNDRAQGLENLKEALLEDYSLHTLIYTLSPELQIDKEISSMILYYAGE